MITTEGFRDIIHIGRHQRPAALLDHAGDALAGPAAGAAAPPQGRDASASSRRDGEVLVPLDEDEVRARGARAQARGRRGDRGLLPVLLPQPAPRGARASDRRGGVSPRRSSPPRPRSSPQFREFERFTTAAMNAFIGPKVRPLRAPPRARRCASAGLAAELHDHGARTAASRRRRWWPRSPVLTLLSGPAAGVLGGAWAGALVAAGGGSSPSTSAAPAPTSASSSTARFSEATARDTWIAGFPLIVPMIDIHTIGAGGGCIAHVDPGGAFRVGPRSAGRRAGAGRLRPRRHRADRDRRQPRPRSARPRQLPRRRDDARRRRRRSAASPISPRSSGSMSSRPPRACSPSSTATWPTPSARGRSRRASTRATSRWSPSAAPGRCTAPRSRRCWGSRRSSCRPSPGSPRRSACSPPTSSTTRSRPSFRCAARSISLRLNGDFRDHGSGARARSSWPTAWRRAKSRSRAWATSATSARATSCAWPMPDGSIDDAGLERRWQRFHELHEAEYGHAFPASPIEIVNIRVTGVGRMPKIGTLRSPHGSSLAAATRQERALRVPRERRARAARDRLLPARPAAGRRPIAGPAIILQTDSTTVMPPGATATADRAGNLLIAIGGPHA